MILFIGCLDCYCCLVSGTISASTIEMSQSHLFRALCEFTDHSARQSLLTILSEMYTLMPKVGYLLLYFLSADRCSAPASERRTLKEKAAVYKDLCESIDAKYSLDICLVNDMRQCQEDDVNMFVHLVPEIFANFPRHSIGNVDLLYLIVSCIDGGQIQTLVCHILSRDIVMFKKDSFKDVVQSSLQWETFEQYAMWYLASAHDLPVEPVIPLLPRIHSRYPEAQSNVLLMLKKESPSYEIIKNILAREVVKRDPFVTSVLTCWMSEYDDTLADLISTMLVKQASSFPSSSATSGKRKRGGQPGLSHPAELCLGHLDMLRQRLANHPKHADFLNQPSIRSGLQTVRSSCTETQKSKFSDLFALADSDSESEESSPPLKSSSSSSKSKRSSNSSTKSPGKSKKSSAASAVAKNSPAVSSDDSDSGSDKEVTITSRKKGSGGGGGSRGSGSSKNPSRKRTKNVSYKIPSEESSDEEEVVKRAPKKKKKVSSAANSDSD